MSNNIVTEIREIYKIIHGYAKFTDKPKRIDQFIKCIHSIRKFVFLIDEFEFIVSNINIINSELNKGIDEDQGLEIRLLNSEFNEKTYLEVADPIYKLYEKIAEIGHVNSKDEELQIVRMETGSFFIKFNGNKAILKTIASIIENVHKIIIRNYTREGQKQNLAESTDLFKKQFDMVQQMKDDGLDVDEHLEIARETLVMLMKQSSILLSSSPDVRINKKVLSRSEDIKKALETDNKIYLEDTKKDEVVNK